MFEKILIPLDGSINAEMAIPYAEEIASNLGSQINLASVSDSISSETERLYRTYLDVMTEKVKQELINLGKKKEVQVQSQF
jgi:nucleotide-binding universal stress UspA family protein